MKEFTVPQPVETGTLKKSLKSTKTTLNKDAHNLLMRNLSRFYSNPEVSILREYVLNAVDSTKLSGSKQPVLLEVKTDRFSVEDFGTGLNWEDIVEVYSQYGASTKRETNSLVGGFGLGGKSAFALTESFSIVSRKNGTEITVEASRRGESAGTFELLSSNPTAEPNGTKVSINIPVMEHLEELKDILCGLESKTVKLIVSGWSTEFLPSIRNRPKTIVLGDPANPVAWIKTNQSAESKQSSQKVYAVVGPVVYKTMLSSMTVGGPEVPLPEIYLNVPVGSVELPATREELVNSPRTKEALDTLLNTARVLWKEYVLSEINRQSSFKEAIDKALFFANLYPNIESSWNLFQSFILRNNLWRGQKEIKHSYVIPAETRLFEVSTWHRRKTKGTKQFDEISSRLFSYSTVLLHKMLIVETRDTEELTKARRDFDLFRSSYTKENSFVDIVHIKILFNSEKISLEEISDVSNVISFKEFQRHATNSRRLVRTQKAAKRKETEEEFDKIKQKIFVDTIGTSHVSTLHAREVSLQEIIDSDKPVAVLAATQLKQKRLTRVLNGYPVQQQVNGKNELLYYDVQNDSSILRKTFSSYVLVLASNVPNANSFNRVFKNYLKAVGQKRELVSANEILVEQEKEKIAVVSEREKELAAYLLATKSYQLRNLNDLIKNNAEQFSELAENSYFKNFMHDLAAAKVFHDADLLNVLGVQDEVKKLAGSLRQSFYEKYRLLKNNIPYKLFNNTPEDETSYKSAVSDIFEYVQLVDRRTPAK